MTKRSVLTGLLIASAIMVLSIFGCGKDSSSPTASNSPGVSTTAYVSWTTGNDATGDGSKSKPYKTLAKAYQFTGVKMIKMEASSYTEVPSFKAGVDVEGGYTVPAWTRGALFTIFNLGVSQATADSIGIGTVISKVQLLASNSTNSNSIALYSKHSTDSLVFFNCRFVAANAGAGTNGTNGLNGVAGTNGNNGGLGSCDESQGEGGAGAIGFGYAGANGGRGGYQNGPYNGVTGSIGGGGAAGGGGGNGGDPGSAGSNGSPGANGANGGAVAPASSSGIIVNGMWSPWVSNSGFNGLLGNGGGGGGGGGAQNCALCDNGGGNGGGGGASGGQNGTAAGGGAGGWGSFAVLLFESSPNFDSCYFETGNGGNGGAGGIGGKGGVGGTGGLGANVCLSQIGAGGNGGDGGAGGGGAGGTGGPGGPSYGVYKSSGSTPTITTPTYTIGNVGSGGAGGLMWGTGVTYAPSASNGLKGDTN